MAILSVSRRTDIPTFYSEWFIRRLEEENLMTRNPRYPEQVYRVPLNDDTIDCIVFWTKNPIPMLPKLDRIKFPFYTQFTLTGYGKDMEAGLPEKTELLRAFRELSEKSNGYVIWRYDPIVFTSKYTMSWHVNTFANMAGYLRGYTKKCVISFVDMYSHIRKSMADDVLTPTKDELTLFCRTIATIAAENGMEIATCSEVIDLDSVGIKHNKCIDPDYIEEIIGTPIKRKKDGGQRGACGCIESIEVGTYNSCYNGCKYCYACTDKRAMEENRSKYNPDSPLLCDSLMGNENITDRKMTSVKKK